jgi:DNA-binding transcriptional LysR family regulator
MSSEGAFDLVVSQRHRREGSVRTTAAEGLCEAAFAGLGLCVASEWMFRPDLSNGRVKRELPAQTLPPVDLCVPFPTGAQSRSAPLRPPLSRISYAKPTFGER